ncbi:MAG: transglycosylase SLT domain-containing protein [Anaerolinea sp.]|nr:transglycosylase SLT domain-containing protein [Anaerolinea sp.]
MSGFAAGVRAALEMVSIGVLALFAFSGSLPRLPAAWWWLPGRLQESPYQSEIIAAARRYDLDPALLDALVEVESGYSPTAVSPAGAVGLTQLMPGTAVGLGVTDRTDPIQNLDGGARYLAWLLQRYDGNVQRALAAYNAGPGTIDRCNCIPNRGYVDMVLSGYEIRRAAAAQPGQRMGRLYQARARETQAFPHGLPGWEGVDLAAGCGTPLYNPLPGQSIVTYNGMDGYDAPGYGESSMLTITGDGMEMTLLHGVYYPVVGTALRQGDLIGKEASVGWSTWCHSHVILRVNGRTVNYLDYFVEDEQ